MPFADSCFEFPRDLEKKHYPDLVRRRAAEFAEDVHHYSREIELTDVLFNGPLAGGLCY